MSASQARHDIPSQTALGNPGNNMTGASILQLTERDLSLFDPLTAAAARLMIRRGKAVLVPEDL